MAHLITMLAFVAIAIAAAVCVPIAEIVEVNPHAINTADEYVS